MSIAAQQRVFRFRNDTGDTETSPLTEVRKVRRPHRKSRNGCQACKERRIKCDEVLPRCSYCQRLRESYDCIYSPTRYSSRSHIGVTSPSTLMHDMSTEMVRSDLNRLLGSKLHEPLARVSASDTSHALHHFRNVTSKTLGGHDMRKVMYEWVPQSAWQQPFVMHMILALASAHLRRLYRANKTRDASYALLEAVHWQYGLRDYRVALSAAGSNTSQEQGDALVTGTLLSMYYTNCLEETMSLEAFNTDYDTAVNVMLAPLAVSRGMSVLRMTLGTFTSSSAFGPVFKSGRPGNSATTDDSSISLILQKICQLDNRNAHTNNLIRRVAVILAPMMSPHNIKHHPDLILSFGGVAYPEIRSLVAKRSPGVMMLLLCWFASLARTYQWWSNARMKSQSDALKRYLISLTPSAGNYDAWSDCISAVFDFTEGKSIGVEPSRAGPLDIEDINADSRQ